MEALNRLKNSKILMDKKTVRQWTYNPNKIEQCKFKDKLTHDPEKYTRNTSLIFYVGFDDLNFEDGMNTSTYYKIYFSVSVDNKQLAECSEIKFHDCLVYYQPSEVLYMNCNGDRCRNCLFFNATGIQCTACHGNNRNMSISDELEDCLNDLIDINSIPLDTILYVKTRVNKINWEDLDDIDFVMNEIELYQEVISKLDDKLNPGGFYDQEIKKLWDLREKDMQKLETTKNKIGDVTPIMTICKEKKNKYSVKEEEKEEENKQDKELSAYEKLCIEYKQIRQEEEDIKDLWKKTLKDKMKQTIRYIYLSKRSSSIDYEFYKLSQEKEEKKRQEQIKKRRDEVFKANENKTKETYDETS